VPWRLLHFIPDADDPGELIRRYLDAVPAGSYLAISHASSDLKTDTQTAGQRYNSHSATAITFRSRQEVTRFVSGLEWTPTGFVDTIRSGTMVYEERTGSGTGSQEVHPGI